MCIRDRGDRYFGYHIGSHDDGYVSSSSNFNRIYEVEAADWTRHIVAWGTAGEMRAFETGWLKGVDARNNGSYINMWNNDDHYVHTNAAVEHGREYLVGTLKEAGKKKGTNSKFYYKVNIDGNYAHCKPVWVSDKDSARITVCIISVNINGVVELTVSSYLLSSFFKYSY